MTHCYPSFVAALLFTLGTAPAQTRVAEAPATSPTAAGTPSVSSETLSRSSGPSHLHRFAEQMPQAKEWTLTSLEHVVPPAVHQSISTFSKTLREEAAVNSAANRPLYLGALQVVDHLAWALAQRAQVMQRAGGGVRRPPAGAGVKEWDAQVAAIRTALNSTEAQFADAIRKVGGLDSLALTPLASTPSPVLPPFAVALLPSIIQAKKEAAEVVTVSAVGPAGTNFGVGQQTLKLAVNVSVGSEVPKTLQVSSYWVVYPGKKMVGHLIKKNTVTCTAKQGATFTLLDPEWFRTDGATKGIYKPNKGVYRGWVVAVHDASGKKVASAASVPEFHRHAP